MLKLDLTNFVRLRAKTYSYLVDDGSKDKKAKSTEKCIIKRKLEKRKNISCLYKHLFMYHKKKT